MMDAARWPAGRGGVPAIRDRRGEIRQLAPAIRDRRRLAETDGSAAKIERSFMPYHIDSSCVACGQGDRFMIGNWPAHLGVYVCSVCKALTNISVETRKCPGCGHLV